MEIYAEEPGVTQIPTDLSTVEAATRDINSALEGIKLTMNWDNCKK